MRPRDDFDQSGIRLVLAICLAALHDQLQLDAAQTNLNRDFDVVEALSR